MIGGDIVRELGREIGGDSVAKIVPEIAKELG
jgi:hypothetical protein